MRRGSGLLALVAALALPASLAAQALGMPVVNNGYVTGMTVAGDVGLPNDAAGGGTALGASVTYGAGLVGLTASASRHDPDVGEAVWSSGIAATFRVFGGPLVPFRVTAQAGAGIWDPGPQTRVLHVPISLGLSATIPNPAFAIRPWVAPRFDLARTTVNGVGDSESAFAVSGGIELGFINGLRLRAAYDRTFRTGDPAVLAFGLGYAFGR